MATQNHTAPARPESSDSAAFEPFTDAADLANRLSTGLYASVEDTSDTEPAQLIGSIAAALPDLPELDSLLAGSHGMKDTAAALTFYARLIHAGMTAEMCRRTANPLPMGHDGIPACLQAGILAYRGEYAHQAATEAARNGNVDPMVDAIAEEMRYSRHFQVERDTFHHAHAAETVADAEQALRTFAARMFRAGQLAK